MEVNALTQRLARRVSRRRLPPQARPCPRSAAGCTHRKSIGVLWAPCAKTKVSPLVPSCARMPCSRPWSPMRPPPFVAGLLKATVWGGVELTVAGNAFLAGKVRRLQALGFGGKLDGFTSRSHLPPPLPARPAASFCAHAGRTEAESCQQRAGTRACVRCEVCICVGARRGCCTAAHAGPATARAGGLHRTVDGCVCVCG